MNVSCRLGPERGANSDYIGITEAGVDSTDIGSKSDQLERFPSNFGGIKRPNQQLFPLNLLF